ncbi:MAG TPA: chorismate mutase [Dysgonomonas sp.]|nr:chorismate mutase [Dysgonomonas sp.]
MEADRYNSLEDVRYNIDLIDKVIIQLISERSFFVNEAARFKNNEQEVEAPRRVEEVIGKIRHVAVSKKLNPDIAEKVYRAMIGAFIEQEKETIHG